MRLFFLSSFISFYFLGCSSTGISTNPASALPFISTKLAEWNCEKLIEKSNDKSFSLNTLAGLRAHKNCKDFKFDWRSISDFEKAIYADALLEIDPNYQKPVAELSLEELEQKIKKETDHKEKFKLNKQLRQKYRNSGSRDKAISLADKMYKTALKDWQKNKKNDSFKSIYLEAAIIQARVLWNTNKRDNAQSLLLTTAKNLKTENLSELYYVLGKIHEEKEEFTEAVQYYDLGLSDQKNATIKSPNFDPLKVSWIKSWILYKQNKWEEAEKALRQHADGTQELGEKSRAEFFRSRIYMKQNKPEEAKKILNSIIEKDFYSYYALVSYQELGQKVPAFSSYKKTESFKRDLDLSFVDKTKKEIFLELLNQNEIDLAEKAVPFLAATPQQSAQVSLVLAEKGQRYLPLFAAFARVSNEEKLDLLIDYNQFLFPKVHEDQVKKMSDKTELPPSLIYAIMKQESGFNEKSRSHANALGLMQVIPRLAKTLAKKYNINYKVPEDLYDPQINIQLGSHELKDQVIKQNGQLTYMAAAYNAGPNALARWVNERKEDQDIYDFIESIPYDETKMYVKLIARNQLFYERLAKPKDEIAFPAGFIK